MQQDTKTREVLTVLIAVALLVALLGYYLISRQSPSSTNLNSEFGVVKLDVTAGNNTSAFYAYIASSAQQQEQGYMNQTSTGDCNGKGPCIGMIFSFSNYSSVCFWMKNTEIPLKQAWISNNDIITYIYNATPYSTTPVCSPGLLVLETSPSSNIAVGDKIVIANS